MEVSFRTNRLQRNYEESARAIRQWARMSAKVYHPYKRALCDRELSGSVQYSGDAPASSERIKRGELSIYLTGRWRLIVTKGDTEEGVTIEEVSNHYDD